MEDFTGSLPLSHLLKLCHIRKKNTFSLLPSKVDSSLLPVAAQDCSLDRCHGRQRGNNAVISDANPDLNGAGCFVATVARQTQSFLTTSPVMGGKAVN